MAPTPEQARIVANLKAGLPFQMSIPIFSLENAVVGFLTPITSLMADNGDIIDALFRWRRANMSSFLTVFEPTPEKTRTYLTTFSLPDPARILFLATSPENRCLAHIGLCNVTRDEAEIDNVIRGEPTGVLGFMVRAHVALLRWAFLTLDLRLAYLNVLAGNTRAIRTYEKVGLRAVGKTPLRRVESEGGYRLVPSPGSTSIDPELALVRMEISRDAFYRELKR